MDFSKPLSARELADATGLRSNDLSDLKPGMPRKSPPLTVSLDGKTGVISIVSTDADGNKLTVNAVKDGANFKPTEAIYGPKSGKPLTLHEPADMVHVASGMSRMKTHGVSNAVAAMTEVLRSNGQLHSGQFAGEWSNRKHIEQFHAVKDQPMHFAKPAHMPNATPHDALKYHLGNNFKPSMPAADGSRTFTLTTDTQTPEKLVLKADKAGQVIGVELNGKPLPATREVQHTVVEAAREAAALGRPGDKRNNPTISAQLHSRLGNELRHHDLPGAKTGAFDYLHKLTERMAPVVPAAAPPAKPAVPVGGKMRGFATVGAMVTTAALSLAATHLMKPSAPASGGGEGVDTSALSASLQNSGFKAAPSLPAHQPGVTKPPKPGM